MKKAMKSLIFGLVLTLCIPFIANASVNDEEKEAFFSTFEVNEDDFSTPNEGAQFNLNDFKYLYLNKGFDKRITPTFSSRKNISGEGKKGTIVGIVVTDNFYNITDLNIQTIGASGLYNDKIKFDNIGINYIYIYVKKDDDIVSKKFTVNRKEEETKNILENISIDFSITDTKKQSEQTKFQNMIGDFVQLFK